MRNLVAILCYVYAIESVLSGIAPAIPAHGRAEYYLLQNDGSYTYGYDTGSGSYAKQRASKENEVEGSYTYNNNGELVDVKYTSGVQGFVPELPANLRVLPIRPTVAPVVASPNLGFNNIIVENVRAASEDSGDKTYSFGYQSDNHERQESSDAAGFVKGRYSYTDETGTHNLEYKAGPETGFEVIGGSLAQLNGLLGKQLEGGLTKTWTHQSAAVPLVLTKNSDNDGSYSFEYNAGDSSRQESSDASGNVRGRYSFANEAGNHDLSYVAGADTGFQVTGGSLAQPNGLSEGFNAKSTSSWSSVPASKASWSVAEAHRAYIQPQALEALAVKTSFDDSAPNSDGSYSFEYNAGDSSRKESADSAGNVRGRYSFTNEAGNHDLSYVAGADTGFQVTGGSLAQPNGLSEGFNAKSAEKLRSTGSQYIWTSPAVLVKTPTNSGSNDGSYSFEYNAGDSSRQESADPSGNVRGRYSFTNEAGNHDLSYVAGADTGFQVTGGSLAQPNGLSEGFNAKSAAAWPKTNIVMTKTHVQQHPLTISGHSLSGGNTDGSYSFEYQTNDQSRKESSDPSGNVRGSYTFTNDAGTHDLSYVAGADTGFQVIGGSLAKMTELPKTTSSHSSSIIHKSHTGTTAIHGSGAEVPIAGRSVLLKTGSGSIGTKWLPVPENYKSGYYFTTTH